MHMKGAKRMKKIIAFVLFVAVTLSFSACGSTNNPNVNDNKNQTDAALDTDNNNIADGFINKAYGDNNLLYAFVKSYLDYKKPAMEALAAKKSEFKDTVALLAEGDWAVDLPIKPLENLKDLEKSGNSWDGTVSIYNYDITKTEDLYSFKFTNTAMEEVTEGSCDVKAGTLQMTVRSEYTTQKYQVKALGDGAYLRFWSEKAEILEETRTHYTYFSGNDACCWAGRNYKS